MNKSDFLDNPQLIKMLTRMLSGRLFGEEQLRKLELRYADMQSNFDSVDYDHWDGEDESKLWHFSSGITPYMDFDDTSSVPIPITSSLFHNTDNIISFDFPIWFNLHNSNSHRVVLLSQDPMPRSVKWYKDCRDAICSSVFGQHSALWRAKGNGGMRMSLLVQELVNRGLGVYLTDCYKLYIQSSTGDHISESKEQRKAYLYMLKEEIDFVKPSLIVTFGNKAAKALESMDISEMAVHVLKLPHFSGQAQGSIKKYFDVPSWQTFKIEEQAKRYAECILSTIFP